MVSLLIWWQLLYDLYCLVPPVYLHNYNEKNLNIPQTNSSVLKSINAITLTRQKSPETLQVPVPANENPEDVKELSWRGSPNIPAHEESDEEGTHSYKCRICLFLGQETTK